MARGVCFVSEPSLLQCVISAPDGASSRNSNALGFDDRAVRLSNPSGTVVVFDSFSCEEERKEWGGVVDTVNEVSSLPSVPSDWSVCVSGKISAVVGPENIAALEDTAPKKRGPMVTEFDEELQELKRHCALLTKESMAETLLSMRKTPGSFADVLSGGAVTPPIDDLSAAVSALCAFGRIR